MSDVIVLQPVNPWARRVLWIGVGTLAAAAVFAAGAWWRAPAEAPALPAVAAVTMAPAAVVPALPPTPAVAPAEVVDEPAPKPAAPMRQAHRPVVREPVREAPRAVTPQPLPQAAAEPIVTEPAPARRVAATCFDCGVVEAVRPVVQKGEGSGLGAVAGGVLGGVLGNQVGKGNGRKAMTVIGAIGGGMAGHEIEKRTRTTTQYEVRVRMDDGSQRTLTMATEPVPGSRVVVEGNTLRPAAADRNSGADGVTSVQTGSRF